MSASVPHDAPREPWWSSEHEPADAAAATSGATHTCTNCPVCSLLRMVEQAQPELLHHVTEAARHLTLAAKAVIEAQARAHRDGGVQHVPLDDE